MGYQYNVNQTPATGADSIWSVFQLLLAQGWTIVGSGDGLALYSASGNVLIGSGAGAGGLANPFAWANLVCPAYNGKQRSLLFQIGAATNQWRVKYSPAAGFIGAPTGGGVAGPTVTPSAADEQYVWTNTASFGTDAAPQFAQMLDTDGSYKWHTAAGDTSVGFSFYAMGFPTGSKVISRGFSLASMVAGSSRASDPDASIVYFPQSSANIFGSDYTLSGSAMGFVAPIAGCSPPTTRFASSFLALRATVPLTGSSGTNAITGKDDAQFLPWGRLSPPGGSKGFGALAYANSTTRTNLDTINLAGTKDQIYVNGNLLPWAGVDPTGVTVSNWNAELLTPPFFFKRGTYVTEAVNVRKYPLTMYHLTAYCPSLGRYVPWVDSQISLANAPPCGGGYDPATLQVLGTF
jgi:hypothetical protein